MEQSAAQGCGCWRAEESSGGNWEIRAQTSPTPAACVEQELLDSDSQINSARGEQGCCTGAGVPGATTYLGPRPVRCHSPGAASEVEAK